MRPNEVDLGLHLLDDQLIDAEGARCGRVDDIELSGGAGTATRVAGLLVGPAAWPARLPRRLGAALQPLVPGSMRRVDWSAVEEIGTTVKLSRTAAELGLGTRDGRNVRWVDAPADGTLRLSSLLGAPVATRGGRRLGRVREVRAERMTSQPGDHVAEQWIVTGLLVGNAGILERLGVTKDQRLDRTPDAQPPPDFLGWTRLVDVGERGLTVSD